MGALNSTLKDNKIDTLKYNAMLRGTKKTQDAKKKNINILLDRYKKGFNKHGFYQITVNLEKLDEYFNKKNSKFMETFDNIINENKIIENFTTKKNNSMINPMFINLGSLYGFYAVNIDSNAKNNMNNKKIKIIVSKTLLLKSQYRQILKFIFDEWLPNVFPSNDREKEKQKTIKSIVIKILEKINSKKHPETAFSNTRLGCLAF